MNPAGACWRAGACGGVAAGADDGTRAFNELVLIFVTTEVLTKKEYSLLKKGARDVTVLPTGDAVDLPGRRRLLLPRGCLLTFPPGKRRRLLLFRSGMI